MQTNANAVDATTNTIDLEDGPLPGSITLLESLVVIIFGVLKVPRPQTDSYVILRREYRPRRRLESSRRAEAIPQTARKGHNASGVSLNPQLTNHA
jgi:hypothetical protein